MLQKAFLFSLLLLLCFSDTWANASLRTIERLRFSSHATKMRIVLDADGAFDYRYWQLHQPPRLVVEIKHIKRLNITHIPLSSGMLVGHLTVRRLSRYRYRLIFEWKPGLSFKVFTLPKTHMPYRWVLDVMKQPANKPVLTSTVQPVTAKSSYRDVMIVIDPGHGGRDPGAIGPHGSYEKDIVLSIAKKLQYMINHQPGFRAVLTRYGDYYMSLRQRLSIARRYKAHMFIAIHSDAYRDHLAHGASIYALSSRGASSAAARWLAKRENASELMGGVHLSDKGRLLRSVLINLSQTASIRSSLAIGKRIIDYLKQVVYLHHHRIEQAAFVVLKSPDIPSLLVETGFLSNGYEERRLSNALYQGQLAWAMMQGIRCYFVHQPPRKTRLFYWYAINKKHPVSYVRCG